MNLVDYHMHTELCGHAHGSIDEYIQTAISLELNEIGFSDHSPLPENLRKGVSMSPEEMEPYLTLIGEKKQQYKDRIIIKTGFEIDFPLMNSFDEKYLNDTRLDYLIGSCHFIGDWAFDHPDYIKEFERRDINLVYEVYYKNIMELIDSGYFNIIGHFDLVKKFGHRATSDFSDKIVHLASKVAGKINMAVEINTSGIRKPVSEIYPSDYIIQIFFDNNTPVTLGSDAHNPEEVGYSFDLAIEKIKKAGYRKISGFFGKKRYDIAL
jgi:histidinol-phosphatase (PHP family)